MGKGPDDNPGLAIQVANDLATPSAGRQDLWLIWSAAAQSHDSRDIAVAMRQRVTNRRHLPANIRKTDVRFNVDSCKDLAGRGSQRGGDFMPSLQVQALPGFPSSLDQFQVLGIQFYIPHLLQNVSTRCQI